MRNKKLSTDIPNVSTNNLQEEYSTHESINKNSEVLWTTLAFNSMTFKLSSESKYN